MSVPVDAAPSEEKGPPMKYYEEDIALGICERAHVLIEGKTIQAKAAHGKTLWPVIDSLVHHHGYRLVMVPGNAVLRMPAQWVPLATPFVIQAGVEYTFAMSRTESSSGKTPARPHWLEREIKRFHDLPAIDDGIAEAVQRDAEAHSRKFAPPRFTPALPRFLGGPR